MKKNYKIALQSALLALALIIGIVESKTPPILPIIPYAKIGFGNIVILLSLLLTSPAVGVIIVIAKSLMIGVFSGNIMSIMYSMPAGLISYLTMALLIKTKIFSLPMISAIAGVLHNLVQIIVASIVLKSISIYYYFAYLGIFGLLAGYVVGIICFYVLKMLPVKILFSEELNKS